MISVYDITDERFKQYGRVVDDLDISEIIHKLEKMTIPEEVVYEPSEVALERLPVAEILKNRIYGELPIQIGFCIGKNHKLNAVEYHRNSEINITATEIVLLLGKQQDITEDYTYNTANIEAFHVPKGCAVELYATTLHYAPCNTGEEGFLVAVVLPKGTNCTLNNRENTGEGKLLTAKNKWLIGHPEAGLSEDCYIGLIGENIIV